MDYGRIAERMFAMDDKTWMRHANPWSGWTRVAGGLLLFLALWSFHWIGPWALLPVAIVSLWLRINPGFFRVPERRDAWMSRGVFGERVWLNRKAVPIPPHHARMAHVVSAVSVAGLAVSMIGLITGNFPVAVLGWAIMMLGKFWFIDRMVRLYEDMREANPEYARWSEPDGCQEKRAPIAKIFFRIRSWSVKEQTLTCRRSCKKRRLNHYPVSAD